MRYEIGTKVFGDWEIVSELGEGSYGKVFRLEKNNFRVKATSALKVMTIPRSQAEIRDAMAEGYDEQSVTEQFLDIVEKFVDEIAIMAELKSHPNIVSVEDYMVREHEGTIGWDILIRMELLTPLLVHQAGHPMEEEDVCTLAKDICEALIFCQSKKLIHRDIKPGNVFVDSMGRYKLGDFGVARTAEKTMSGMSKQGTESYMAPEVYYGRDYGPNVDIYSLGMMLYRLMNQNRLPFYPMPPAVPKFREKEEALVRRLKGEALPTPTDASEDFAAIILKACEADPALRYHTAEEMLKDLKKGYLFDRKGESSDFLEVDLKDSGWSSLDSDDMNEKNEDENSWDDEEEGTELTVGIIFDKKTEQGQKIGQKDTAKKDSKKSSDGGKTVDWGGDQGMDRYLLVPEDGNDVGNDLMKEDDSTDPMRDHGLTLLEDEDDRTVSVFDKKSEIKSEKQSEQQSGKKNGKAPEKKDQKKGKEGKEIKQDMAEEDYWPGMVLDFWQENLPKLLRKNPNLPSGYQIYKHGKDAIHFMPGIPFAENKNGREFITGGKARKKDVLAMVDLSPVRMTPCIRGIVVTTDAFYMNLGGTGKWDFQRPMKILYKNYKEAWIESREVGLVFKTKHNVFHLTSKNGWQDSFNYIMHDLVDYEQLIRCLEEVHQMYQETFSA